MEENAGEESSNVERMGVDSRESNGLKVDRWISAQRGPSLAVWHRASHLTFLSFGFLIFKMKTQTKFFLALSSLFGSLSIFISALVYKKYELSLGINLSKVEV